MNTTNMYTIDTIMSILKYQFKKIKDENSDYDNIKLCFANERIVEDDQDSYEPNKVTIVVKFGEASIMFGQNLISFQLNVVSEENKINVCQNLLLEYAQYYNLHNSKYELGLNQIVNYNQTYTPPTNVSAFNEMFVGYRSLFSMTGTILFSYNINDYDLYFYVKEDDVTPVKVNCITNNLDYLISLDTQPTANSNNYTKSAPKYSTITINFTAYLTDETIFNRALDLVDKNELDNNNFVFEVRYTNGRKITKRNYKMISLTQPKNAGEMPLAIMTFTN